jgi:MFS family permease
LVTALARGIVLRIQTSRPKPDMQQTSPSSPSAERSKRRLIGFLNWAHALDHYVMLIFPTVVIGLVAVYGRSYAELIALATPAFAAFGLFSLPAGWLADHWSRRNMMVLFYFGCGVSLVAAGLAPDTVTLAAALFALGMFAAIYHPVGAAMLIEISSARGRTLAFNGVCGNLGAALAAGITAALVWFVGWRGAFLAPAVLCLVTGIAFLRMVPDDRHHTGSRKAIADVVLMPKLMAALFGLFVVMSLASGLTFNVISVALPKIVDERLGAGIPLVLVGSLATAIFMCGALAQLAMGRLVEKYPPRYLLAAIVCLQLAGLIWAANASGVTLLVALAVTMTAIYGQVTAGDIVVARYTADAWRGRIYAVRFFLTFTTSAVAVSAIAFLHARGGFDAVLAVTAGIAAVFVLATLSVVLLVSGAENGRGRVVQPAE